MAASNPPANASQYHPYRSYSRIRRRTGTYGTHASEPIDINSIQIIDLTVPAPRPTTRRLDSPSSDRPQKRQRTQNTSRTREEYISVDDDDDDDSDILPLPSINPIPKSPSKTDSLSQVKCVICLDSPTDIAATPCGTSSSHKTNIGHLFCDFCIRSALKTGQARPRAGATHYTGPCPICRRRISTRNVIPLEIKVRS
jgi:hypothetical protein